MIIIEGMDNSGKTTLANQLLEKLPGYTISKLSEGVKPTPEQLDQVLIDTYNPEFHKRKVIMDRFALISELVYGGVLRGGGHYGGIRNLALLNNYLETNPFWLIYCRPPNNKIKIDMGKQMVGVGDNVDSLILEYDVVMSRLMDEMGKSKSPGAILKYNLVNDKGQLHQFLGFYNDWRKTL